MKKVIYIGHTNKCWRDCARIEAIKSDTSATWLSRVGKTAALVAKAEGFMEIHVTGETSSILSYPEHVEVLK